MFGELFRKKKAERYPICLTCLSVMEKRQDSIHSGEWYHCPGCCSWRGPVTVWGSDPTAVRIGTIAEVNGLKPLS